MQIIIDFLTPVGLALLGLAAVIFSGAAAGCIGSGVGAILPARVLPAIEGLGQLRCYQWGCAFGVLAVLCSIYYAGLVATAIPAIGLAWLIGVAKGVALVIDFAIDESRRGRRLC